jgi:hypothetical protein
VFLGKYSYWWPNCYEEMSSYDEYHCVFIVCLLHGWMDGCMHGWMDAWMDGCMHGWMDIVGSCRGKTNSFQLNHNHSTTTCLKVWFQLYSFPFHRKSLSLNRPFYIHTEYELAMLRWAHVCAQLRFLPPNPEQMEKLVGLMLTRVCIHSVMNVSSWCLTIFSLSLCLSPLMVGMGEHVRCRSTSRRKPESV